MVAYRMGSTLRRWGVPLLPAICRRLSIAFCGIDILPQAEIGGGCYIPHGVGLVVGGATVIGEDCTLLQGVTLGEARFDNDDCPTLGDRVTLGAGAKILGGVSVGDEPSSAPAPWWWRTCRPSTSPWACRLAANPDLDRIMAPPLSQAASALTTLCWRPANWEGGDPESPDWLFRHIQLEIEPGDRLALVGPTGSGKSLILRALALLDSVDEGEIAWRGKSISDRDVPEYRARAMYLQQRSPVLEGTVEDNLKLPFELHLRRESPFPENQLAAPGEPRPG